MIPIKDFNPTRRFPVISVAFIALNIAVFFYDRLTGHFEPMLIETARGVVRTKAFVGGLSAHFSLVPATLTSLPLLAWPTIFTSMFLHGNWLHIGSNMLYLWIFGNNVEDVLGRFRFILFYFACGAAAAIAQVLSAPQSDIPMVGASGAVAGVMGAYLVLFPRARILTLVPILFFFTFIEVPAFVIIGWWALIQFLNASWLGGGELQRGGVAYFAHLGGFVTGMVLLMLTGAQGGGRSYRRR
ncbi:rhomboid family intramembrane serine protease [Geobacter pickeringii]|uniref:Membrane protein n=1 Tax=Geobacter pickeringii TaxID=345632 RepID=A0A0B5BHM1_9BACT|nr:rhomboid family intramembrane serine protease [Geobacter pickeringii]AJE03975.1 membrane protein [Geobacter pickeringii]